MCILILRVAFAEMLSVASSSYECRERIGGDRDHRRSQVRGGDPRAGEGPRATTD